MYLFTHTYTFGLWPLFVFSCSFKVLNQIFPHVWWGPTNSLTVFRKRPSKTLTTTEKSDLTMGYSVETPERCRIHLALKMAFIEQKWWSLQLQCCPKSQLKTQQIADCPTDFFRPHPLSIPCPRLEKREADWGSDVLGDDLLQPDELSDIAAETGVSSSWWF